MSFQKQGILCVVYVDDAIVVAGADGCLLEEEVSLLGVNNRPLSINTFFNCAMKVELVLSWVFKSPKLALKNFCFFKLD